MCVVGWERDGEITGNSSQGIKLNKHIPGRAGVMKLRAGPRGRAGPAGPGSWLAWVHFHNSVSSADTYSGKQKGLVGSRRTRLGLCASDAAGEARGLCPAS